MGGPAALAEALALGWQEGYVPVFVDEGPPMAALLGKLATPDMGAPRSPPRCHPPTAIAEELVVTLETVKSHVAHILGKLGVANRTQAVTRARELGLLR